MQASKNPEASIDIANGPLGSVRFVSPALERAYIDHALQKSLANGKHTPLIAAVLFAVLLPMDVALIGNGVLTTTVIHCMIVKAVWIALLVLSSVAQDALRTKAKSFALIFGWFGSVFVIWYVAAQAPPDMAKFYLLQFGLASLSMITLLPALVHWQVPAMNLFLIVPVAERVWQTLPAQQSDEIWQFFCMAFILCAICLFTVVSKRSYERALREDFALRLQLADARDAATAADNAKSAFLSAVSHDMRTPLNAILGNLQVLQQKRTNLPQDAQVLSDAETASRTLLSLVESVLHSASGEAHALRPEDVSTSDLLNEVRSSIQTLAERKGLRFETSVRGDAGLFSVDKRKLVQVLLNILTNSTKFTREGLVGLRLRVRDGQLRFLVYDTGPGMSADVANKAFAPFFQSPDTIVSSGSSFGLGLAITHDIVAGLGGSIRLRSQPGRGTVVAGWIPVQKPLSSSHSLDPPKAETPDSRLNILIIEDEALNIAVLGRMLDSLGQNHSFAETGAAGIEAFEHKEYDCVFVDIQLPDMTGFDVLNAIKAPARAINVPTFAVTANVLGSDTERYEIAGFDGVLAKPIEMAALVETLHDVALQRRKPGRAAGHVFEPFVDLGNDETLASLYRESMLECVQRMQHAIADDDHVLVSKLAHRVRGTALCARDNVTASRAQIVEHTAQDPSKEWRNCAQELLLHLEEIMLPG